MSPWPIGGATTYVVNLVKTFEATGVEHRVIRPAKRTEKAFRQMSEYGVYYRNMAWEDIERSTGIPLLASAPTDEDAAKKVCEHVLLNDGKFVFHDPNEFKIYPHWRLYPESKKNCICIRETGLDHVQGVFIPHPFVRTCANSPLKKQKLAVSIARTSPVKNSMWIIEANHSLPPAKQITMLGEVNRMWWKFNVLSKYPDEPMPAGAGFARTWGAPAAQCLPFQLMVDMTIFKKDGGGTQYSILEAMDAGAVPVLTKNWCSYPGPADKFGFQVEDAEDLHYFMYEGVDKVQRWTNTYRAQNYNYLDRVHAPPLISAAYKEALGYEARNHSTRPKR